MEANALFESSNEVVVRDYDRYGMCNLLEILEAVYWHECEGLHQKLDNFRSVMAIKM